MSATLTPAMTAARPPDLPACSLLDAGDLPVEELARLCEREGWRPRPIYGVHRWFARRFGTAVRALLVAAATPVDRDFWTAFAGGADLRGRTLLDPFVGGGTSVVEARRLGAAVTGVDVDAVACAITRLELAAATLPDLAPTLDRLKQEIGAPLRPFYQTLGPDGAPRDVLHFFWVQQLCCRACGGVVAAHPHFQLAYEAEGSRQWVFCAGCGAIHLTDRAATTLDCDRCGHRTTIAAGNVRYGRLTCPHCGARERLIDAARQSGQPPTWRLFALETLAPAPGHKRATLAERHFQAATAADEATYQTAAAALAARRRADGRLAWVPERAIPLDGRADDRLPAYGYRRYAELFNARQLLHLTTLAEAIAGLPEAMREAFGLAFSDHLTTNCLMTHYAFGWRRLAPLFSLRAYRHVTRPVELNPWLDGTGRGTFPNAVRAIQRAAASARAPREPRRRGGFRPVRDRVAVGPAVVLQRDARDLAPVASGSVDLVLTDPPYFDNIAYAELSDFYLPWLQLLGLAPDDGGQSAAFTAGLAARGRDATAGATFAAGLAACFQEITRVLRPEGRVVFTYQHRSAHAWLALARAIAATPLRPIQVFPLLGDHGAGLHAHAGNSRWDAVIVLASPAGRADVSYLQPAGAIEGGVIGLTPTARAAAHVHQARWRDRLQRAAGPPFRQPDADNLLRACLVAGALAMFPPDPALIDGDVVPLLTALESDAGAGRKG